jgi:hypothetical protein
MAAMWVHNAWYVAAWSHEVAGEGLLACGPNLFRGIVQDLIGAETSTTGAAEVARAG